MPQDRATPVASGRTVPRPWRAFTASNVPAGTYVICLSGTTGFSNACSSTSFVVTAGKIAFAENGNWQMGTAKSDAKFAYGVAPLPLGDGGQVYLGGEGEGIGAFSKNPELAWKYLSETYFDKDGQILPVTLVGSIPSRLDSAQNDAVSSDELLKPFAESIAKYGANYPADVIPPEAVADVQLTIGQAWSAALSGQSSPGDAAATAMTALQKLLG